MTRRLELVFILFMVSGFGGLIYESVWTHYIRLFLGHSAYAQTLVLVVFIGGLAAGAWACSRFASRLANPLRWYAAVELVIGIVALVFHSLFVAATDWGYATLLPATCDATSTICMSQWLLSAALLLPQSVLIGATFPLVSSAVLRMDPTLPGHHVAMLYFLNSLGAVFGVLASIFLLIPAFGLPGTLTFVGAANLALAAGAYLLARATPPPFAVTALEAPPGGAGEPPRRLLRLLLATAFFTGLSSFIYEIVWIRMLSLVLGASTFSFELMLASFILGLALGGLWIRQRVDAIDDPVRFLGVVQIVMGVAAAATLPLYNGSFDLMAWLLSSVERNNGGFLLFNLASTTISLLVMLPATFCAGMTLPLITYRLLRSDAGERALGLVYSVNTLGSIAGVVAAVHLLMTWLGLHGALLVGAAIDVALGVLLIRVAARGAGGRARSSWAVPVAGIAALALFAVAFPMDLRRAASGVFRSGVARITPNTLVALHVDGKTATVDVLDEGGMRVIRTNGKTDAALEMDPRSGPTLDELTMAMLALMPLGHNPDARTAAVIGLGSGMSTHVLLGSPRLERVDSIEIEPAMVEGARLFRPKVEAAFSDPRSRIVIDDAKSYFARAGHRYDIIVSEPSNPWVSGVASLFTEEFYRRLAHSLNDGGVLSQWIHSYEMDAVGLASIINAVAKTFPDFIVYTSVDSDIILVARKRGPIGAFDDQVLRWPAMREVVDRLVLEDPGVLARRSVGSSSAVLALYGPLRVPANSDYFPLLEQRASKTRFTKQRVTDLTDLQAAPLPLLEMLDGTFRPSAHRVKSRAWGLSDRAASDAWGYHDLLLDPSFVPAGPAPASDSREHAARVVSLWAANCPGNLPFSRMLPSLATMAEVVNPNLAAETALEVWRHLGRSRCAKALAPGERRWLELFTAVAARDAAVMAEAGTAVLESARGTRGALNEYAFIAATTGLICQDRLADANRLFEHATRDWLPAGGNATAIRYLYAMANLPPGTTRPATAACGGKLASRDPGPTSAATRSDSARGRSTGR